MLAAIFCCVSSATINPQSAIRNPQSAIRNPQLSDAEFLGIPLQPQLTRWRHVADERRGGDDDRAGEKAFAAEAHAVLPVAVERRNRALPLFERIRPLSKTGTAPRLSDLPTDRAEHFRNRFSAQAGIGAFDLETDAAGPGEHDELSGGLRGSLCARGANDERRREQVVVAAVRARADHRLVERQALARDL